MRIVIAAAAALFALLASAVAQEYLDAYKAYNAAMERGDRAAAVEAAERAWRAAEKELGDDATTAVLAYNYAYLIVFSRPDDAVVALRRAAELADLAELPLAELKPLVAYADYVEGKRNERARAVLKRRLTEIEDEQTPPTTALAFVWTQLASDELGGNEAAAAYESARTALKLLDALPSSGAAARLEALLVAGVSRALSKPHTEQKIAEGLDLLYEADTLIDSGPRPEDVPPVGWQIDAWIAAIRSIERSMGFDIPYPDNLTSDPTVRLDSQGAPCPDIEYASRKQPRFPDELGKKGYVGAVLVGYDIENNRPVNIRILAEVPYEAFGPSALKAMRRWRTKTTPADPQCRTFIVTQFSYQLNVR